MDKQELILNDNETISQKELIKIYNNCKEKKNQHYIIYL